MARQDLFDPCPVGYGRVGLEAEQWRAFQPYLVRHRGLQPGAGLDERSVGGLRQGGQQDGGVTQVGLAADGGYRHELEAGVGPGYQLDLVSQDLAQDLVDPGHAGVMTLARPGRALMRAHGCSSVISSGPPPVPFAGDDLDFRERPHKAFYRIEHFGDVTGSRRHCSHRQLGRLPPVLFAHLRRCHAETVPAPLEYRPQYRPLFL